MDALKFVKQLVVFKSVKGAFLLQNYFKGFVVFDQVCKNLDLGLDGAVQEQADQQGQNLRKTALLHLQRLADLAEFFVEDDVFRVLHLTKEELTVVRVNQSEVLERNMLI